MTPDPERGTIWLFIKVSAFTVLVPGTWVVLLPYLLLNDAFVAGIDFLGLSLLGAIPILLGAALYVRSAYDFAVSGRGTPAPIDAPIRLVTSGPYRHTRNPMYLGILAILFGEVILYRHADLLYVLSAALVLFVPVTIYYEEPALRRQFGQAYDAYCRTVPRWIPTRSSVTALYKATFLKVGAFVLAAGAVAHVLRLSVGLPVAETPTSLHGFLVVLPAFATFGCIIYSRRIALGRIHQKVIFGLIVGLLLATTVMHTYSIVAQDNSWYRVFPLWYSVLAVFVYGGFAHFLKSRMVDDGQPRHVTS